MIITHEETQLAEADSYSRSGLVNNEKVVLCENGAPRAVNVVPPAHKKQVLFFGGGRSYLAQSIMGKAPVKAL